MSVRSGPVANCQHDSGRMVADSETILGQQALPPLRLVVRRSLSHTALLES